MVGLQALTLTLQDFEGPFFHGQREICNRAMVGFLHLSFLLKENTAKRQRGQMKHIPVPALNILHENVL